MKINPVFIGVGLIGVGAYIWFKNSNKDDSIIIDDSSNGGGGIPYNDTNYTPNEYEKKSQRDPTPTPQDPAVQDFKTAIYKDNYNSLTSGGSSKKSVRYIQNDTLNFTVVKVDDKTVGGFDFENKQSINVEKADLLQKNKNNKIVSILRGTSK